MKRYKSGLFHQRITYHTRYPRLRIVNMVDHWRLHEIDDDKSLHAIGPLYASKYEAFTDLDAQAKMRGFDLLD